MQVPARNKYSENNSSTSREHKPVTPQAGSVTTCSALRAPPHPHLDEPRYLAVRGDCDRGREKEMDGSQVGSERDVGAHLCSRFSPNSNRHGALF